MTREETIARVKHQRDWANEVNRMLDVEAFDMAIKALEQEPCEDAVSRKSVITIIQNHWWNCRDIDKLVNELPPVTPQEQFKPMVEIDLYSVIKQKYIEREVLDEIRTEIEEQVLESLSDGGDDWFTAEKVNECLEIIDKYKAESEVSE